jgi:hypothetical protein
LSGPGDGASDHAPRRDPRRPVRAVEKEPQGT